MALTIGTQLGSHEITALLGKGGMGEVYRARDLKLKREVAVKILPEEFSRDSDRIARFQREAEVLASLNHPNIAAIYDLVEANGSRYLVLELVEGETLADRIARGPIPASEALTIAIQICDALDAAHERGIIHRDLKPANVKLTPDGKVKVLDFGLAKALESTPANATLSNSPTMLSGTMKGMIVGTAAYMSPEQARGHVADQRSDVFAFGCILYEMLTGRQTFDGNTVSDVLAAVLRADPDFSLLPGEIHPRLIELLRRCLDKNTKRRWHAAADLKIELETVASDVDRKSDTAITARPSKLRIGITAASLVASILMGVLLVWNYRNPHESKTVRFQIQPPEKTVFDSALGGITGLASANAGTISPDGRTLAFTARDESGRVMLWIRPLDSTGARTLPGADGAALPFWSPDSKFIGFFVQGKLKKMDAEGGPPVTICDAVNGRGGTWNRDGVIVFAPNTQSPVLLRVSAAGGEPAPVTRPGGPGGFRFPYFLPDGNHFLFTVGTATRDIFIGSLDSLETRRLSTADSAAIYAPSGHLLFVRQGTLLAQPFDDKKLVITGEARPIAEQVASDSVAPAFSVSEDGTLAYRTGAGIARYQLAWVDRSGKLIEALGVPALYQSPAISPDGKRIAFHRHEGTGGDLWIMDAAGAKASPLTFDASQENSQPMWSADGSRIVFGSLRNGKWGIYQKLSNGTGNEELLFESELLKLPMSWSAAINTVLFYVADPKNGSDVWALPLSGERKVFPLLQSAFSESHPQISPDGKWFAYESNKAETAQIYVESFPPGHGKFQVSNNGGVFARWRPDGKELFYMDSATYGKIVAIDVHETASTFEFSAPHALFDSGYVNAAPGHTGNWNTFDVSADGQRFLIPRPDPANSGPQAGSTPITVILNWTGALKKQ